MYSQSGQGYGNYNEMGGPPQSEMQGGGSFGGGFSHKAPVLATDMRCYFSCPEGFKKDIDLRLHLKLRHKNENEAELRRAYQAAEEEIALVSATASVFQCALCPKKFNNSHTFYDHVGKRAHNMAWLDYKAQYGRCEVESAPFECKICGRVVKYTRSSITNHMKMVHSITWPLYLERIRNMREGDKPKELPNIEMFECKICSAAVKYIFRQKHLKGVHKITEGEYMELFANEAKAEPSNEMSGKSTNMDDRGSYYGNGPSSNQGGRNDYYNGNQGRQNAYPTDRDRNGSQSMQNYSGEAYEQKYSPYDNNNNNMSKQFKTEPENIGNNPPNSTGGYERKNVIQPPNFKRQYEEDRSPRSNIPNQRYPPQNSSSYDNVKEAPDNEHEMSGPEYDLPLED